MKDFKGKVAVITGAGSGVGRSLAIALAKEGADVVIADIESSAVESVVEEVSQCGGGVIGCTTEIGLVPICHSR